YTVVISGNPGPTPGDVSATNLAEDLRSVWLTDVCKAVTTLGASYVTWPVAGLAAIALGMRRRWPELAVLVVPMLITSLAVHVLKVTVARPRPTGALVETTGKSFPSAHAAYSVVYAWLAVTLAVRLRRGLGGGSAIVATGIVLTAAIGLTRVYLGAHYL